MDELDNRLIAIVKERKAVSIADFMIILSMHYYEDYTVGIVRDHANSCVKHRIFNKTPSKTKSAGRAVYIYTLRE